MRLNDLLVGQFEIETSSLLNSNEYAEGVR